MALARHDVNKNLPALFRGIDQLQRQWPQWSGILRIIGRGGRQTSLVHRLRNALPRPEQVELISALPQAELVAVLRSSMALLSASMEEGFDYPVLEAKAEGIHPDKRHRCASRVSLGEFTVFCLDDDGTALARRVIDLCREPFSGGSYLCVVSSWRDLSAWSVRWTRSALRSRRPVALRLSPSASSLSSSQRPAAKAVLICF